MAQSIIKCSCKSDYQDKRYGKGFRLCNLKKKEGECRCTVCAKDHSYKPHELTR